MSRTKLSVFYKTLIYSFVHDIVSIQINIMFISDYNILIVCASRDYTYSGIFNTVVVLLM